MFIAIVFILSAVINLPTSWKDWIHSAFTFSLFGLPSPMLNCPRDVAWTLTLRIYRPCQNQLNVPSITQDQTRGGSTISHLIFICFVSHFTPHGKSYLIRFQVSYNFTFHYTVLFHCENLQYNRRETNPGCLRQRRCHILVSKPTSSIWEVL